LARTHSTLIPARGMPSCRWGRVSSMANLPTAHS
jgi:hypothetical protein